MSGTRESSTAPAEDRGDRKDMRPGGSQSRDMRDAMRTRMRMLETQRSGWIDAWRDLAQHFVPLRFRYLEPVSQSSRNAKLLNRKIIDNTGRIAGRNLAAGMLSGLTSPSRPWFRLRIDNHAADPDNDARVWLAEVEARMQSVMASSNYYTAKAIQYWDLVIFGTAPMIIYEDRDSVIRCFNPVAGEYFVGTGPNFSPDTLYRQFAMTALQLQKEFGEENISENAKRLIRQKQGDAQIMVSHGIEPNPAYMDGLSFVGSSGVSRDFRFREVYWEGNSTEDKLLRVSGYLDQPFSCPRWEVAGNDAYGMAPGFDALGDVKQLQQEQRRKAQAIDKMVDPPMVASAAMRSEPASLLPGSITYVPSMANGDGFKPAYQVNPNIGDLKEDIRDVQSRIKDIFYNDLFLMISQLETVRSATEIDARKEEKLLMLGPVLERNEAEGLTPDIRRIFNIMARNGLLPPPPPSVQRFGLKISYVSMLSEVQSATTTAAIERVFQFAGSIAGVFPQVVDNFDVDATIRQYAEALRTDPRIFFSERQRDANREQRQQQANEQAQLQNAQSLAVGAKTLSEADVGGGQNALSAILGNG